MSVDRIVGDCLQNVPKAVAAGVVDMGSGMLLAVKTVDSHPQEVLDLIAGATREIFEGDNVSLIENTFSQVRGLKESPHYLNEMVVNSQNLVHIFSRLKNESSCVMAVVMRADVNLGMALMKTRGIAQKAVV